MNIKKQIKDIIFNALVSLNIDFDKDISKSKCIIV